MSDVLTPPPVETILCDTSFVSVIERGVPASWPADVIARLDAAEKAISVITIAELRAGHVHGKWQPPRRARAEQRIGSYLWIPLDMAIVDEWARLDAACRSSGKTSNHNDVWIAATANTRKLTLVSCDKHFDDIPDVDHIKLPRH